MLPACRTDEAAYTIPTFDVVPGDVEGFMDELWEFQAAFHDCFARSEPRAHFFDYMVGQFSPLERKSIEPMALRVEGGTVRGLQRLSVRCLGMRSRCSGTIISSWPYPQPQRQVSHRSDVMHRTRHDTAPLHVAPELSSSRMSPWRDRLEARLSKKSPRTATTP
jgi:hypothetical protein